MTRTQLIFAVYHAGRTPATARAIHNLKSLCEELELGGRYEIEELDIRARPELAESAGVLATPTVVRQSPPPVGRVVGDLSDRQQVLDGLLLTDLPTEDDDQ